MKRLKPQPKQNTRSWQRRNEARSVLQQQYAKRVERERLEREAADALIGTEPQQ